MQREYLSVPDRGQSPPIRLFVEEMGLEWLNGQRWGRVSAEQSIFRPITRRHRTMMNAEVAQNACFSFQDVEPFYKYTRPKFASSYSSPAGH